MPFASCRKALSGLMPRFQRVPLGVEVVCLLGEVAVDLEPELKIAVQLARAAVLQHVRDHRVEQRLDVAARTPDG